MTLTELRKHFPMPWSYVGDVVKPGRMILVDAKGTEVPLMTMLDFVVEMTRTLDRAAKAAQAPAPNPA